MTCNLIDSEVLVLTEWPNWTHTGCERTHIGLTVTCPNCGSAHRTDSEEWSCPECDKEVKVCVCTQTNNEFVALQEWNTFTHAGCKINHHW